MATVMTASPRGKELDDTTRREVDAMIARGRVAMRVVERHDQARIDRLCQALAWAIANEKTFTRLAHMSVDESKLGDREGRVAKRFKIMGVLRDALRQKSIGVIEELPEKGIVKYAKPAGVIAGLLPVTNPVVTMVAMAINGIKCRDAIVFSPHPASKRTALETTRILRAALAR